MKTSAELEDIVRDVVRSQAAAGVLMVIITKNQRAEVVAAVDSEASGDPPDLPSMLRQIAEEVEAGGGVPTGRHLQSFEQ